MSFLDRLDSRIVVAARRQPASASQLDALRAQRPGLPPDCLELALEATELELEVQGCYLRIWGPSGILEMDEAYGISAAVPGAIPVGDDEGGSALVYMKGSQGQGLYLVGLGDLDRDDAVWLAPDPEALLCRGLGLEKLDPDRRY